MLARLGGVFRITDGLQDEFGANRVFNTPLAESSIAAISVGLAIKGFRPVAEMQFDAFSYPAFNQVTSNIAKYSTRTSGACNMQLVIRIPYGGNIGAVEHHSESPETYYTHTAGLKVVTPSTPSDAYAMLTAAIRDPDPVIFLEPKARYWQKEDFDLPLPPASARTRTRRPHRQRRHHHRLWPDGADCARRRRDRRHPKVSRWKSLTCAASRRSTWIR